MKIITHGDIVSLNIPATECVQWSRCAIREKNTYVLPPKISLRPAPDVFYNTMPCMLPEMGCYGVKIVSRQPSQFPSLDSQIMVYDLNSGSPKALMDGNWITAMRTGAFAAIAIETLACPNFSVVGIIGLGNVARAVVECLSAIFPDRPFRFLLRQHKDHADLFRQRFKKLTHVKFETVETNQQMIAPADVVISCLTHAAENIGQDEWFGEGVLVVPVHTLGFQNCDLFFDKVICDDTGHVKGFKYFSQFRRYAELTDVLLGKAPGRENACERILSYNVGIAVQDIYFASKIIGRISGGQDISLMPPQEKFWF